MTPGAGRLVRWAAVWTAIAAWFVLVAFAIGGNAVHLLLVGAMALLVYELLAADPPGSP